jgi:ubiquinone/menaquinone biosynthesis C-methylase UbiE
MGVSDTMFAGSIPGLYDRYLGPLLFEPYAREVAKRAAQLDPRRILETAAGTGIVTEALHRALLEAKIVATDLNPAMLEVAAQRMNSDKVSFQPADAQDLPFEDGRFNLVVCQFGAMFFPDKVKGNAEARRVLREGGTYLLVIWDRIDRNPVSQAVADAVAAEFPDNPPRFLERAPFSYADPAQIERDVRAAGFTQVELEQVEVRSRVNAREAAYGMCCGSPMTAEIAERGADAVDRAAQAAELALQPFDGREAPMSAWFVTATK